LRGGFLGRQALRLAVDRAAARRVDHLPRLDLDRTLEHVDRAHQVDAGVVHRIVERRAHARLRGEVEDDLGPVPFEQRQ
jgi:hypothetical protein